MNKKGFTLVELLAVVVILALILAIAVPAITNITTTAKKNMFENSSKMILKSMKNDYDGRMASNGSFTDTFILYDNGVRTVYPSSNSLDFTISATDGGIVRHSDGTVTMALYDGTNCSVKTRTSNDITVTTADKATCVSNVIYKQASAPFTNLVTNGDFSNGTTGWFYENGSINTSSNTLFLQGNGGNNFTRSRRDLGTSYANKYIYIKSTMRVTNDTCAKIRVFLRDGQSTVYGLFEQLNPKKDNWYTISGVTGILTSPLYNAYINVDNYYADAASDVGKLMEVKNIIAIDLTSVYGSGNEPTQAQMDNNVNKVWIDTTNANSPKMFTGGGWINF